MQIIWCGIPAEVIDVCFSPEQTLHVPTAPALGLLLVECFYDLYNRKFKRELRRPIELKPFATAAESFKTERIYPFIASKEKSLSSMEK